MATTLVGKTITNSLIAVLEPSELESIDTASGKH